jgi:hypothetical protein
MILEEEYARLLGYPAGKSLEGTVLETAGRARSWYELNGRPRVLVRDHAVAITAGVEVEIEIARLWQEDRVDEAYFLDRFAVGVVEHHVRAVGASPGSKGWNVGLHGDLMQVLGPDSPVELLPSGMLKPVHSILAVVTGESTTCTECTCRCVFRRTA